jgi:glycosyltransferase involved in cell wall biosynthesis
MRTISVIIPTFNAAQHIGSAIGSVLAQSVKIHEICVVDDGSTDHTQRVLERFAGRIRSFRQDNQGPAAARNRALEEVTGDVIIFLDADDTLDRNAAAALTAGYERAIQLGKKAGVVYGDYWLVDAARRYTRRISGGRVSRDQLIVDPCVIPSGMLVSRDCVAAVGKFDPTLNIGEDWEYCLRIACAGFEFVKIPEITCVHREHGGSLSKHEERAIAQSLKLLKRWESDARMSDNERARIRREVARTLLRRVRQQIYSRQWDSVHASLAAALNEDPALLGDPFLISYCTIYVGPFLRESISFANVNEGVALIAEKVATVCRRLGTSTRCVSAGRKVAITIELFLRHRYIAAAIDALIIGLFHPWAVLSAVRTAHYEWARTRPVRSH